MPGIASNPAALRLRPYQRAALTAVTRDFAQGYKRLLIQLATGTGKTIVFAAAIRYWQQPTLIIVHRQELAQQALDKLHLVWPDADVGLVRGRTRQEQALVVVSTVQTLAARPVRRRFTRVIIDEAHHAVSPQWQQVLHQLGFDHPRPDQLLLGVTATTQRLDGRGLHTTFDRLSYRFTLPEAIRQGYLAPLRGYRIRTQISLDHVPRRHGDYAVPELSRTVDIPARNQVIGYAFRQLAGSRVAIGFAVNIAHAQHLTQTFRRLGIASDWVAGSLPASVRRARLQAFHTGSIQVLWNAQILTEGYDEPGIACVILARPTQSPTLFAQMVGRGTRKAPGKTDCLILDMVDLATRYPLQDLGQLLGQDVQSTTGAATLSASSSASSSPSSTVAAFTAELTPSTDWTMPWGWQADRLDILAQSLFRWQTYGSQWILPCDADTRLILSSQTISGTTAADLLWQVSVQKATTSTVLATDLPLTDAMAVAEDWTRIHPAPFAHKSATWLTAPATAKQQAMAQKLGIVLAPNATKDEASTAIAWALHQRQLPSS